MEEVCKYGLDVHLLAIVGYTFTHKQLTEYRERNIHKNKKLGTNITIKDYEHK
jgi:hypothetical protein